MCKVYGYRFDCNHTSFRTISSCRRTYAYINNPTKPRCIPAGSGLVIYIPRTCPDCVYSNFVTGWQSKIEDVKTRIVALSETLRDFDSGEDLWLADDWNTCAEEVAAQSGWGSDTDCLTNPASDCDEASSNEEESCPSEEPYPVKLSCCDAASLKLQRDILDKELAQLQADYNKEAWNKWHSASGGATEGDWESSKPKRVRCPKVCPRVSGCSPLRTVTNASDLPPSPSEESLEAAAAGDGLAGDSDDGSTISVSSIPSPRDGSVYDGIDWATLIVPKTDVAEHSIAQEGFSTTRDWLRGLQDTSNSPVTLTVNEVCEDDDMMMPDWGNA